MDHSHHDTWMAHGWCFQWDMAVAIPWILGNGITALCYGAIPIGILALRRARPDMIPAWLAWSFAAFIAFCGAGHVVKIYTLWEPVYRLSAWLDVGTAIASLPSAIGLGILVRNLWRYEPELADVQVKATKAVARAKAAEADVLQYRMKLSEAQAILARTEDPEPVVRDSTPYAQWERAIQEHLGGIVCWADADAVIRKQVGAVLKSLPPHPSGSWIGTKIVTKSLLDALSACMETGKAVPYLVDWLDPEGEIHKFHGSVSPWYDGTGHVIGGVYMGVLHPEEGA